MQEFENRGDMDRMQESEIKREMGQNAGIQTQEGSGIECRNWRMRGEENTMQELESKDKIGTECRN